MMGSALIIWWKGFFLRHRIPGPSVRKEEKEKTPHTTLTVTLQPPSLTRQLLSVTPQPPSVTRQQGVSITPVSQGEKKNLGPYGQLWSKGLFISFLGGASYPLPIIVRQPPRAQSVPNQTKTENGVGPRLFKCYQQQ